MTLVAAALVAMAAWLLVRSGARAATVGLRRGEPSAREPHGRGRPSMRIRSARVMSLGLGAVLALVVGGVPGVIVGAVVSLAGPRVLAGLESRDQRQRRLLIERQSPIVADLLATCLAAGATPRDSVRAVARAVGEPIATPLGTLTGALDLGADPVDAWAALAAEPGLRQVGRAGSRSAQTGAPLASLLAAVAEDQRDEARSRAEAAARAAGVRSVAPLVSCFLPAFILIGIVPVVASLALPLLQ